jgi:hypothetical protein
MAGVAREGLIPTIALVINDEIFANRRESLSAALNK